MRKIKILHIQETIGSGGVERRRLSLAKHLDKEIFDQKFVCTNEAENIPNEIRAEGFEVIALGRMKSSFHWSHHKKVQKIIEEYKPDIIHGAVFEGVTLAAINGWLKKVPVIIIEETSDPQNRSWRGNLLMKLFSSLAHKIIGVSEGVVNEYLIGKLGLSQKKAVLINNGVVLPRNVSEDEITAARLKYHISEEDFVIGSVGRMLQDEHKRFSDLIKAFALFAGKKPNVKLLLVGEGPEQENYQNLAKELGVLDKVIFAGYQPDVTLYYKLMNVFSLVSAYEAFGLVLAEAMLNRLPVVATRVGGMKYIVDDKRTGFLIHPKKIAEIEDKFEQLYQDRNLGIEMGMRGYEKAMTLYTEKKYVQRISTLYKEMYCRRATQ